MTEEKFDKIIRRLLNVVGCEKDMIEHDLLSVCFAFCSIIVATILSNYSDKNEMDKRKAAIKKSFISKLVKHVDELEPKEG